MDATGRYENVIKQHPLRLVAVLELWVDTCKSGATTVTRDGDSRIDQSGADRWVVWQPARGTRPRLATRHPRSYVFIEHLTLSRINVRIMLIKRLFGSCGSLWRPQSRGLSRLFLQRVSARSPCWPVDWATSNVTGQVYAASLQPPTES